MSVVGSLEDLSFPDILQVVHLSRQSGTLILSGEGGEKRVRFRNGLICDATLGEHGPHLDEILVQRGLVAPAALEPARRRQSESGESLASALLSLGALSQDTLDRIVREELRVIVRSLVLLQEGEFRFEMDDDSPDGETPESLSEGLGPEAVLSGLPAARAPRWPTDPPPLPNGVPRRVLLVSERSFLTLALREELQRVGFEAVACDTIAAGVTRARTFAERGEPFFLVCDLVLPDQAQIGWRGGMELLRDMRAFLPGLVALMIGEVRHPSAAEAAKAAGASGYLTLPDLSEVPFDEIGIKVRDFCSHLCAALCLSDQLSGIDWSAGAGSVRVADPLSLLRGLIGELNAEGDADVPLLVLRLAAEYFERAALFSVSDNQAVCRGGFGEPLDARLRGVSLPLASGSILKRVVDERETTVGAIPEDEQNRALLDGIGPPASKQAAVLPVVSGRDVFGVLYGDNGLSGAPLADLRALEIFLSQAGLTIQNALLRRRIASLTADDGAHWRRRATA